MVKRIMIVCLLALLVLPVYVYAAEDSTDIVDKLNLTPKQVEQIRDQKKTRTMEQDRIRDQIRIKESELKDELAKEEPSQVRVRNMVREINRLRASEFESKVNAVMETKRLLTREQLREMTKLQLKDGTGDKNKYQHRIQTGRDTKKGK